MPVNPAWIGPCQLRPTHIALTAFSILGGIMNEIRTGAAALRLTIDPLRNEDVPRPFQPMYHPEAAAGPQDMTPSPAFQSDVAKKYLHLAAFILATLPIVASLVLGTMAILERFG